MALTPKQQRFVEEYLIDLNATQAAIRAKYSRKTAASQGERLLRNVEVAAAVKRGTEARAERCELDQDYVVERLKKEANRTGKGASHAARVQALHLLGKHLKMFDDRVKVEHSGHIGPKPAGEMSREEIEAELVRIRERRHPGRPAVGTGTGAGGRP